MIKHLAVLFSILITTPSFAQTTISGQTIRDGTTPLTKLVPQAAGTVVGNTTGGSASPIAVVPGALSVTATGGTTARTLAARAAEVINVKDFGALCDGNTAGDDAAAINAAIAEARVRYDSSVYEQVTISFPRNSEPCIVKSTVNLTGFDDFNRHLVIEGNNTAIYGRVNGKPVVDALGSHRMIWRNVSIRSDLNASIATYGLVVGAINDSNGGAINTFENLNIVGYFSKAGLMNLSGEQNTWINPTIQNFYAIGDVYAAIFDGANHFDTNSDFITQAIGVDAPRSFNANTIINGRFLVSGNASATPIWIGGSRSHTWISSYAYNELGAACVRLSQSSALSGINQGLHMDLHCEDDSLQTIFEMVGPYTTPVLYDFAFSDGVLFANDSVFSLGAGVISASIRDLDLKLTVNAPAAAAAHVFDNSSSWTSVSGNVYVDSPSLWNEPNSFIGRKILGTGSATTIGGSMSGSSIGTNGIGFRVLSSTYTDTGPGGAITSQYAHTIGVPTFSASTASTISNAYTLNIAGCPVAGTNVTLGGVCGGLRVGGGENLFAGLSTFSAGLVSQSTTTIGGGQISLNAGSNNNTLINTGTSNGTATVGNASATVNVRGTVNINASLNGPTNIGTGSTTSNVTIGGGSNQILLGSVALLKNYTVATLPTCSAGSKYAMAAVSDASAPSYNTTVIGGGAVAIPVFCNGTNWVSY